MQNAWNKYGEDSFEFNIEEVLDEIEGKGHKQPDEKKKEGGDAK